MSILLSEDIAHPLPKMYQVRQQFDERRLDDVAETTRSELNKPEIRRLIKAGGAGGHRGGSLGIRDLYIVVSTTVACLNEMGARPFIVSAMGSHGNGTEEGQREVLAAYGITEENLSVLRTLCIWNT